MKNNRIAYAVVFCVSLLFLALYGGEVSYTLFFAIIISTFISIAMLIIAYSATNSVLKTEKQSRLKGDTGKFFLEISNEKMIFIPFVIVIFSCYNSFYGISKRYPVFSLIPKNKKTLELSFPLVYCGQYNLKVEKLELVDPMGLFKISFKGSESKRFFVYPSVFPLEKILLDSADISDLDSIVNKESEDIFAYSDIREYIPGDRQNRIHWIQTARVGEIMVKKYDSLSKAATTAILDLRNSAYTNMQDVILKDALLCAIASFYDYCSKHEIPLTLMFAYDGNINLKSFSFPSSPEEFFSVAELMVFGTEILPYDIIKSSAQGANGSFGNSSIILFSFNFDSEMLRFFNEDAQSSEVMLIYPQVSEELPEQARTKELLKERAAKMFPISIDKERGA